MKKFVTKPKADEAEDRSRDARIHLGQLFTAMPADRQQQVDREPLVHHIGKLELHLEDRDQEPQIEKQEQRLEEIVFEVVPELLEQQSAAGSVDSDSAIATRERHECVVDDDPSPGLQVLHVELLALSEHLRSSRSPTD